MQLLLGNMNTHEVETEVKWKGIDIDWQQKSFKIFILHAGNATL